MEAMQDPPRAAALPCPLTLGSGFSDVGVLPTQDKRAQARDLPGGLNRDESPRAREPRRRTCNVAPETAAPVS